MITRISLHAVLILVFLFTASMGFARDYIIYSIVQEVPMTKEHNPKKNYYVNIGKDQGLKEGSQLEVFRILSRIDPYTSKQRYNYKVKMGELEVIHSEKETAIAVFNQIEESEKSPLKEIRKFMIGDSVDLKVK